MGKKEEIAEKLKQARINSNKTQKEVADLLGMTYQAISNYERGKTKVESDILVKLCDIYQISVSDILSDTQNLDMHKRLKRLRKELDLTQQEFAARLNVNRNTVATYEEGKSNPSGAEIILICREFNVNEKWLRNGTGDMFLPHNCHKEISRLTRQLLDEEEDSFKNRFIAMLADFSAEEWEILEHRLEQLYTGKHHKKKND